MRGIDIPAKVLEAGVNSADGLGAWPYDDGSNDPYWAGGVSPADYQWRLSLNVLPQLHSGYKSRQPKQYNGMDVQIGNWIAERETGVCVKIISIESKTENSITCIVEDVLRYNTFRSPSGYGLFNIPASAIIFELNDEALPVVDPVPASGIGSSFFANLMSRFQNVEGTENFLLDKEEHDFVVGDLVSADPSTNSFVKTGSDHPYLIGTVSFTGTGPNKFMINPIQKINEYDDMLGDIGDIIYADANNPGKYSLSGSVPVLIKLRNSSPSTTVSTVAGATSTSGYVFSINGTEVTLSGTDEQACVNAINIGETVHGITAGLLLAPTIAQSEPSWALGEPALVTPTAGPYASAKINGVLVTFSTNTAGLALYGAEYSLEEDMAADINAANIPNITATGSNNMLTITNSAGSEIIIENINPDTSGVNFAGTMSGSGVPLLTAASTDTFITMTAIDARAISFTDITGTAVSDFGLISVENGVKAAALYIEQGIRQASTYVVQNIPARDALSALFGDQCYVQDTGNGEWAFYIYTLDNTWVQLVNKDASDTDARTVEIEIVAGSLSEDTIYTLSDGSGVSFVTVSVVEAFDGTAPTISIGDASENERLMTVNQNDLTVVGNYSTTPAFVYTTGGDVDVNYYFDSANSTTGRAIISITYS